MVHSFEMSFIVSSKDEWLRALVAQGQLKFELVTSIKLLLFELKTVLFYLVTLEEWCLRKFY